MFDYSSLFTILSLAGAILIGSLPTVHILLQMHRSFKDAKTNYLMRQQQLEASQQQIAISVDSAKSALKSANRMMRVLRNISIVAKTVDVGIHCTQRYNDLRQQKSDIQALRRDLENRHRDSDTGVEAMKLAALSTNYAQSVWGLRSDQFDYWLSGVLDHDTFFDWSYYLALKIIKEDRKDAESQVRTWRAWSEDLDGPSHGGSNPQFVLFIDALFERCSELKSQAGDSSVNEDDAAQAVLDLIRVLEGTPEEPGFAREYRKAIWDGMDFVEFYEYMSKDIAHRRASKRRPLLAVDGQGSNAVRALASNLRPVSLVRREND